MKTVYGPVSSWRLGKSLGVDPICSETKVCSFDCVYCQLGKGEKTIERRAFVSPRKLEEDFRLFEKSGLKADVITFSGTGEPTLASNLTELVARARKTSRLPIAVLTNSSFLGDESVAATLRGFDVVAAKLDAADESVFKAVNKPHEKIFFDDYFDGIKKFRKNYGGKFCVQAMFVEANKDCAREIALLARELKPNEVQVNTPLRPCAVKPLNEKQLSVIEGVFKEEGGGSQSLGKIYSVYEAKKPSVKPLDLSEVRKRKRPKP